MIKTKLATGLLLLLLVAAAQSASLVDTLRQSAAMQGGHQFMMNFGDSVSTPGSSTGLLCPPGGRQGAEGASCNTGCDCADGCCGIKIFSPSNRMCWSKESNFYQVTHGYDSLCVYKVA